MCLMNATTETTDAVVLSHAGDSLGSRRAIEANLIEKGVSFRTVPVEEVAGREAEVLASARKALFVAHELLPRLAADAAWRQPLLDYARRNGFIQPYGVSEADLSGVWLRSVVDSTFAALAVDEAIAYAGLESGNAEFLASRAVRDAGPLLDAEYEGLLRWLSRTQHPSEWHMHRGKSAEALMLAGDRKVGERYREVMRKFFAEEHEYFYDDGLSAFYGPVALARAGVDDSLLPVAHERMRKVLARRPRPGAHRAYAGYADDPLYGLTRDHGGGQFSGVNLGIGGHDCVSNEMLHFTATAMVGVGTACGDEGLVRDGVALCDHVYQVHRMPNGLLRHVSQRGEARGAAWGRGQTHAIYGLVYLLDSLPEERAEQARLRGYLKNHLLAILPFQDAETGLWRNVIDQPQARLEVSCTIGIIFALARAIDRGWMEGAELGPVIDRAWSGIRAMMHEGALAALCRGTYAGGPVSHYLARPQGWGMAPQVLMLGVELYRIGKIPRLPGAVAG